MAGMLRDRYLFIVVVPVVHCRQITYYKIAPTVTINLSPIQIYFSYLMSLLKTVCDAFLPPLDP